MTQHPMATVAIQPDLIGEESYSRKWSLFLQERNVDVREVDLLRSDALDQLIGCDGVMWRWSHSPQHKQSAQRILASIELCLGIPVYPGIRTSWHFDEKTAQYYLLQALQAPMPRTWIFWRLQDALHWVNSGVSYPVVHKLSSGAGSSNVRMIHNARQARQAVMQAFQRGFMPYSMNEYALWRFTRGTGLMRQVLQRPADAFRHLLFGHSPRFHPLYWRPERGYVYFQEFLPDNSFDTRVTVIGRRAFAFRRMNRPNDYRASGSGTIDYSPDGIDVECVRTALDLSLRGGFQSMAYDFLCSGHRPVVCEVSYAFADSAVQTCPGHWCHEDDATLTWVAGQMWPEEAQVEEFLTCVEAHRTEGESGRKQPHAPSSPIAGMYPQ